MISKICYLATPFALFVYLLNMSKDDIEQTFFITSHTLDRKISSKLPHHYDLEEHNFTNSWKSLAKFMFFKYIKWPFFLYSKLYVQDHLIMASQVVDYRSYIQISDSPNQFTIAEKVMFQPFYPDKGKTLKDKIKFHLSHGPIFGHHYGTNKQCINTWILTDEDKNSKFIKNKDYTLIDIKAEWYSISEEKRGFIKSVFGITEDLFILCEKSNVIILSQPIMEDCGLSEQEVVDIYSPYVNQYRNVIIKPHPRDKFDYKKYFPDIEVINTSAPMQLLNFLQIIPSKAITICSTAISDLPSTTEKIIIGTKINDKIFRKYGDLYNK